MTSVRTRWDWQSTYPAPAKINLFLHVVGRRTDGYHLLQTLFHLLDYGDALRFSPRDDSVVSLSTPLPGVPPDTDLTVRAARRLQAEAGYRQGVDIRIDKHLPLGGGLGGGSSDAATVLLALNHLWQLGLSRRHLQEIGLSLGADVPVFIFGRSAFAEGVGEALFPIDLPSRWYLVLEPPVHVPTASIFAAPELVRDTAPISVNAWRPGFGANNLEPVAIARFPILAEYIDWLAPFAPTRMSGSGACVFAEFTRREDALNVLLQLPPDMRGWVACGLARHPLSELVD